MASATEELSDSSKAVLGADVVGDYAHRFRQCLVPVLIMLLVVVLVGVATAWYGHSHYGINGVLSAFVAGLVCFLAASAALIATVVTTNTPNALSGVLAGIILRTALPFLVSILLCRPSSRLPMPDCSVWFWLITWSCLRLRLCWRFVSSRLTHQGSIGSNGKPSPAH